MSFERDLRTHLQERAEAIEVPERTLEVLPRRRRRSHTRVWNAISATAVVALTIGGLSYLVNAAGTPTDATDVLPTFAQEAAITPSVRGLDPLVSDLEWVWEKTTGLDVSAVVPLGDGFLVFDRAGGEAGAHAQRTISGEEWVDLGNPVEAGYPQQLEPWGDRIAGVFVDVRTGNPALWSTSEGSSWQRGSPPPTPRAATKLHILGETDGGLLVHATYNDSDGLAEAIRASLEGTYPPRDFFVEVTASTVRVVHRILFAEVASFDRADLNLEPRLESAEPADLGYWWSDDLRAWRPVPPGQIIEGFEPIEVFDTGPEVHLVGRTGPKHYISTDGVSWDPQPLASSWLLTERDGRFIVAGYGDDDPLLLRSDNLRRWEPLPAPDAFDSAATLTEVATGPLGFSGLVLADPASEPDAPLQGFRFEIENEGWRVVYDLVQGVIEVTGADGSSWVSSLFAMPPDVARYNQEEESVTFVDPATGAAIATVTAAQVAEEMGPARQQAALLFTQDYETWAVDFLPKSTDYHVSVGRERIAVVVDDEIWIGRPE